MNVTYTFFVRCSILQRLSQIQAEKWQNDLRVMLNRIPSMQDYFYLYCHCYSLDFKLSGYEKQREIAFVLELILWKSNMSEHAEWDKRRITCGATVIIPLVLSYLSSSAERPCFSDRCLNQFDMKIENDYYAESSDEEDDSDGFFSDSEMEDY